MNKPQPLWHSLSDSLEGSSSFIAFVPGGVLIRTQSWNASDGQVSSEALAFISYANTGTSLTEWEVYIRKE